MNSCSRTYFSNKKASVSFCLSILVFFIHFRVFSVFKNADATLEMIFHIIHSTTYVAVPLFFAISGAMFYRNYNFHNTVQKWKSRFFSLCIPYLAWNSFWVIIALLGHYTPLGALLGGTKADFSVANILSGIFMYKYFEPFWFVQRLIIYVALCPLIYILLKNKSAGIITIILVFGLNCIKEKTSAVSYMFDESILYYLIGAWFGLHCFGLFVSRKRKIHAFVGIIIYAVCCTIEGCKLLMPQWMSLSQVTILIKVISCAAVWVAFDIFDMKRYPSFFNHSFLIYAMHSFVGAALSKIVFLILSSNPTLLPLVAIISFISTIIIICTFGFLLEKYMPVVKKILVGR